MAHHKYYVVLNGGEWKIKYGDKHYGPYETQRDAYLEAARCAKIAGDAGDQAQVFIQGRDNLFRAEWTYGHDPYPPKG